MNFSIIEQLDGKQLVMRLLTHEDPNVRYQALLAVQKVMVHNWWVFAAFVYQFLKVLFNSLFSSREYLGKQLEKDKDATGTETAKKPLMSKN